MKRPTQPIRERIMIKANATYSAFLKATNEKVEEPSPKHVRSKSLIS